MKIHVLLMLIAFSVISAHQDSFHQKIEGLDIQNLRKLALTTEKLIRQITNDNSLGGLHDYIEQLTKNNLIDYISVQVSAHPELLKNNLLLNTADLDIHDIKSFLGNSQRANLLSLARAAEQYGRFVKNRNDISSDTLDSVEDILSDDLLINYIESYIEQYPELKKSNFLQKIAKKGLYTQAELDKQLSSQPRKTLVYIAAAAEKFDKTQRGSTRAGGLFDYAWSLTAEELKNEIKKFASNNPELYLKGFLVDLCLFKSIYVNDLFLGGLGSYVHILSYGEVKYIFKSLPSYFENKFPWLKPEALSPYNVDNYKTAINQLIADNAEFKENGVLERKINFPVGGFEYYLSQLEEKTLRSNALKYAEIQGPKLGSEYFTFANRLSESSRNEVERFFRDEANRYPEIISTEYFKYIR